MIDETTSDTACKGYAKKWEETLEQDDTYYVPEKYQLGIITEFLDECNMVYTTEAEVFCYPIDVVARQQETTMAIELKSRNIGKGIEQACRNSDYVDYSFLSIWDSDITSGVIDRISELDIGLIGVDDSVQIYLSPSKSGQQLCRKNNIIELINSDRSNPSIQQ